MAVPCDIVAENLKFVVENTYFSNRVQIIRQVVGIPMGTNAASNIADLCLYWPESRYIDHLFATRRHAKARKHVFSYRYIDDFGCFNTTPPPAELYGLDYSETTFPRFGLTKNRERESQITSLLGSALRQRALDRDCTWPLPWITGSCLQVLGLSPVRLVAAI